MIEYIAQTEYMKRALEMCKDFFKIYNKTFDIHMFEYFDRIKVAPWNNKLKICRKHYGGDWLEYRTMEFDLFFKINMVKRSFGFDYMRQLYEKSLTHFDKVDDEDLITF